MMYWAFYKSTLAINIFTSLFFCLVARNINVFALSLVTIGLFFDFLYKEVVRPYEYYFYYNRGISKIKLIIFCMLVNVSASVLFLIIVQLCRTFLK